jgi:DNA-binding protein WhiA
VASFANDVKHELALQLPAKPCCQRSELQGFVAAAPLVSSGDMVSIRLASNIAARKAVRLARLLEGDDHSHAGAHFIRGATRVNPSYRVSFEPTTAALDRHQSNQVVPVKACCRRALVRGAYVAGGSVSVGAGGYHLEITSADPAGAGAIAATMAAVGVVPGRRRRGTREALYVKGSEDIATILKAMGASQAVLRFENDRIVREMRAQANRFANTETANLRRVVESSLRQVTAARRLVVSGLLQRQPRALREMATTRMAMPQASLDQMAERLGLSKSAVNARLRRLLALAAEAGLVDLP